MLKKEDIKVIPSMLALLAMVWLGSGMMIMKKTLDRIHKLPLWAQRHIGLLERQILEAQNKLSDLRNLGADPTKAEMFLCDVGMGSEIPLPSSNEIKFILGKGHIREVTCRVQTKANGKKFLGINAGGPLASVSNAMNDMELMLRSDVNWRRG